MSEIRMDKLPKTLDELKAMPQAGLTKPEEDAGFSARAKTVERDGQAVYQRPLSRKRISDAVLFCRRHAGE